MSNRLQVIDVCISQFGYRRGARLAEFIMEWEVCVRAHGGDVSSEEFATWWKESRATTYRRLADFRAGFPQLGAHATPSALMGPLLERLATNRVPKGEVPFDFSAVAVT